MVPAQHLAGKHLIESVAIYIRDVHPHRREWNLLHRQPINRAEPTVPIIDPDPVGSLEVITDIQVWFPVIIEVVEHHAESPVEWRVSQRFAIFIQKGPLSPGYLLKAPFAEVAIERGW